MALVVTEKGPDIVVTSLTEVKLSKSAALVQCGK